MKIFTPIIFSILLALPMSLFGQTNCCCPDCPNLGTTFACIGNGFGTCGASCAITCGNPTGFEDSNDPTCLGTACNVVPIELSAFDVNAKNEGVLLEWETETESNNEGFEVQRMSGMTITWETIAFIEGAGTTTFTEYYSYEDRTAPPGINYYRLKQVDYDGTSSISPVKSATLEAAGIFSLWPTLAKDQVIIRTNKIRNHGTEFQMVVFDMMGRLFKKETVVDGISLDISTFPQGSYIVNIYSEGFTHTLRFMKVE